MASKIYEIAFQLGAKIASSFNSAFSTAGKSIEGIENRSKTANKGFLNVGSGISTVIKAATGMAAVVGVGMGFKQMIDGASASQQKLAQMDAVLKSTGGAAGMTKAQLLDLADAQAKYTTYSKGTNVETENLLLTFTGISNKVFPDVLKATNDMATAMKMDTSSAALTLGKALNDPATGLTKLTKQGVTFTKEQKDQITAMVKAGDTVGAQTIMLKELQREFGGSAEAAGKTFAGQLTILKNQINGVGSSIGGIIIPYLTMFVTKIVKYMPNIKQVIMNTITNVTNILKSLYNFISPKFPAIEKFFINTFDNAVKVLKSLYNTVIKYVLPYLIYFYSWIAGNLPQIQKCFEDTFKNVLNNLKPFKDFLQVSIMPVLMGLFSWVQNNLPQIKQFFLTAFNEAITVLSTTAGAIMKVTSFVSSHWGIVQPILIGIAAGIAAWNIIQTAHMVIMGIWTGVMGIATAAGLAFGAVLAFITSPIGIVVIAIGVLVAIGVALYKNWDKVSAFLNKCWTGIKHTAITAFNAIKSFIVQWGAVILLPFAPFIALPLLIIQHWKQIKAGLSNIWNSIKESVSKGFSAIGKVISGAISKVIMTMSKIMNIIIKAITNNPLIIIVSAIFKGILAVIIIVGYTLYTFIAKGLTIIFIFVSNILTKTWQFIVKVWTVIYTVIASILTKIWSVIVSIWNVVFSYISAVITSVWHIILAVWTTIFNTISSILIAVWNVIVTVWNSVYQSILAVLTTIWTFIITVWNNVYGTISGIVFNVWNTIVAGFTIAYNGIVAVFSNIKNTITTIFMDIWTGIKVIINVGIEMINGFIGGVNKVIDVANKVPGVKIEAVSTIPKLANGGYIKHKPGGILANIGEGSEDEIVSPVSKLKSIISNNSMVQQQPTIIFSPQITITGNASKDDIEEALNMSQSQFNRMMENYLKNKKRLSFEE